MTNIKLIVLRGLFAVMFMMIMTENENERSVFPCTLFLTSVVSCISRLQFGFTMQETNMQFLSVIQVKKNHSCLSSRNKSLTKYLYAQSMSGSHCDCSLSFFLSSLHVLTFTHISLHKQTSVIHPFLKCGWSSLETEKCTLNNCFKECTTCLRKLMGTCNCFSPTP